MVNHLWRSRPDYREEQARRLNTWARQQFLPTIAVGDYNFDWNVQNGESDHDAAYDVMTEDGVWKWVRPGTLVPTQCSDRFTSVLDFVFVAGDAQSWSATSEILQAQPGYCPDDSKSSDHRPVLANFVIP